MVDKMSELAVLAEKNQWQCFKSGEFTWFASDHCPDYGSLDCPLTMTQDSQSCRKTGKSKSTAASLIS